MKITNYSWRRCLEGLEFANVIADALYDKQGQDILLLDLREQAVFADYFLLCSGDSVPQLRALTQSARNEAKDQADSLPQGVEGDAAGGWVLIDFGDLVVHLFSPEQRAYYDLESLWHDGHVVIRMQ